MLFMVIETFRHQDAKAIYRRFRDQGRMMPDGLAFVGSWVSADVGRCFQLMEADDITGKREGAPPPPQPPRASVASSPIVPAPITAARRGRHTFSRR